MPSRKTKVAILGGGMGALSTAWELLQQDPNGFEITVYQRGSRLGGKGASGRNMQPGKGQRIEEHGLHILMGFYDNAFHVLKGCYDALGGVVGPWESALIGEDYLQLPDFYENGDCAFWELCFPSDPNHLPGARSPDAVPDTSKLFACALKVFLDLKSSAIEDVKAVGLSFIEQKAIAFLHECHEHMPAQLEALGSAFLESAIREVVDLVFRLVTTPEARDPVSVKRRRLAMAVYFIGANLIGIIKNGLWTRAHFLSAAPELDKLDYKVWLRTQCDPQNGALPTLTWESPIVNALYDLIFSRCSDCPGGDPGFGAGTALYDSLMVLTYYWGHVFYRMNGGMGDVVFAPLYLYLRERVTFRFFQTVKEISLSPDQHRVDSFVVESQWDGPYDPLFNCNGRWCWREPAAGDPPPAGAPPAQERRVHRGAADGFDVVLLGISVGGLRDQRLTGALRAANPAFDAMVSGLKTVATQSVQLWFGCEAQDLGWTGHRGMLGSFSRPFDAWADMYQVLPHEQWSPADGVKSVTYLCDVYSGPADAVAEARVHDQAIAWLNGPGKRLWPSFDWSKLAGSTAVGPARFEDQYWRVNLDPSDGYVLAAPNTSRFRLRQDESGFENLYLAGDWTRTDLNAGCLEAATKSGRAAARAIASRPKLLADTAANQYLDQDSDWVLRHPVVVSGAEATVFALAGGDALSSFCKQLVESTSAGAFTAEPLEALQMVPVLLVAASLPHVASADPEQASLGYFSENDVGFLVPVTLTRLADNQQTRGFLCPYLFVDSPIGLSAGREIFGLPKALAKIRLHQQDETGPFDLGVTADVLVPSPQPPKVQQAAIIGVTSAADAGPLDAAGDALLGFLKAWLWPDFGSMGGVLHAPLFLGKQIRDGVDPTAACYRALMRCDLEVRNLSSVQPSFDPFNVYLPAFSKPKIGAQLGIGAQTRTRVGFRAKFDLTFPPTRLLT